MYIISNLKKPGCASKQDMLVLVTLQYPVCKDERVASKTMSQLCPTNSKHFFVKNNDESTIFFSSKTIVVCSYKLLLHSSDRSFVGN